MLRFGLGQALLNDGQPDLAVEHFRKALEFDPLHSASWKTLARALVAADQITDAIATYEKGIAVAEQKGDIQAAKEMKVFLKRLLK